MANAAWSDAENDATVANYFAMLRADLAGQPYSKAEHNRALQRQIGRGRGAIEFKHQNISAVLKGLGEVWIPGYRPAFNFQMTLVDAVVRWLELHRDWSAHRLAGSRPGIAGLNDDAALWIATPPTMRNAPPPDESERMAAIANKFDVGQRDERNRALGRAGEERVLLHERAVLTAAGRRDLADSVEWVSERDDTAGFDIASFLPDGRDRLIEVKTTNGWERTPFHISRNELRVADERRDEWYLMRLWNFAREPRAFELRPPLEAHVSLMATSYLATFG